MSYDYDRTEKPLGCLTGLLRYFLMFINLIFILASIGGVVAGVLLLEGKSDNYLKFCEPCKQFNLFLIIVFAALLVFSFTGFCALWKRNSCLLVVYGFFLVIFFLGATCIVVVIFMIKDGRFDNRLESAWQAEVASDASQDHALCKFQADFKCSGWSSLCPSNASQPFSNYTADEQLNCPNCVETTYIDQIVASTQTCDQALTGDINKYFWIFLGVGFGLMGLTLISIIVSCKVRVEYEEYQDLQERF